MTIPVMAKIPGAYAKLGEVEIISSDSTKAELTFKSSGDIRMFLLSGESNSTWKINGEDADFFPLIAKDCVFTIKFMAGHASYSTRDSQLQKGREQIEQVIELFKSKDDNNISIHSVELTIKNGVITAISGNGIQIGSPLAKDNKDREQAGALQSDTAARF